MLLSGSRDQLVAQQSSCFGVGFLLCWSTRGLFLCLTPSLWGKISDLSAGPLLSACCDSLLIVFQFAVFFEFGCCSLAQEMRFLNHYLPYFRQWHITCLLSTLLPFHPLFTESSHADQLLAPLLFSGALITPHTLCCVLVFSSLFIVQDFLRVCVGGSVCPGGYSGLSQGWLGEYCMMLGTHLLGMLNISQAGLKAAYCSVGALLFSQCNVAWRSFVWVRGSGC
jgi:hypothetical protein